MIRRSLIAGTMLGFGLASSSALAQARYTITDENAAGPTSPKVIVLHDNQVRAEAAVTPSEGGELSSFKVTYKGQQIELLYHARDYEHRAGFQGKGPLLWPAVGAQYPIGSIPKESCGMGSYVVKSKSYPMPCHGFARSVPWKEIKRTADTHSARVTLELTDSDATRQYYPYAFHLDANYELIDGHLTIDYVVTADSSNAESIPFSIGNHIALKLPLLAGTDPTKMLFATQNTIQLLRNSVGVLSGDQKERSFSTPEALGTFDAHVALPLSGYKSQPFSRLIDPQGMTLRLTQTVSSGLPEPLIRTNAYGGPSQGYFCPEPWFGVQNSLNTGIGLMKLEPGKSWIWRLNLEIEPSPPSDPVASSGVERVGQNFSFVEGPVWVPRDGGYLLFSDIYNSQILKLAAPNRPSIYQQFTNAANGNSMDAEGRLYSCERDGHRVVRRDIDGTETIVASKYEGKRFNSPNDVVVRRDGQVYFSDPASAAVLEPRELSFNGLYHVTPAGKISLIAKMSRPNGVAITPDGHTLYVADSQEKKIIAYDLDAEGNASNGRTFISGIDGTPDGLRVAENGNLYIACRGIAIYSSHGQFKRMIEFPETPVNCAFGGPDLQTLYVTAHTSVYTVHVPDKGALQY